MNVVVHRFGMARFKVDFKNRIQKFYDLYSQFLATPAGMEYDTPDWMVENRLPNLKEYIEAEKQIIDNAKQQGLKRQGGLLQSIHDTNILIPAPGSL